VVLGGALLGDQDHALTVEQVGHRTGITHAATVTGDGHAHLGSGPVAVVGQTLHEYGDPAGGVTLVHDGLPIGATRFLTGTTLAGTFDVVQRDRTLLRLLDRVVERRVPLGVPTPETSGHLHVLDQLGEELAALGVDDGFLVFGGSPLGVARHACPFTVSTKRRGIRTSPVRDGKGGPPGRLVPRRRSYRPAGRSLMVCAQWRARGRKRGRPV